MPNGLNDPEQQWQGSWGGRFTKEKEKNVNIEAQFYAGADCSKGCFVNETMFLDYWLYADAEDTWTYKNETYSNQWAPIFRWRSDFQNDFASRMDWCIKPFEQANHPPIVALGNDYTTQVKYMDVKPGETLSFSAANSLDPDRDDLTYLWWIYPEAGTYEKTLTLDDANNPQIKVKIPTDIGDKSIHLILSVQDDGIPSLTRYRRVVINGTL